MDNEPSPSFRLLEQTSSLLIKHSIWFGTKNLDFKPYLQLDGSHCNQAILKRYREKCDAHSPLDGRRRGEIDAHQKNAAGRILFACISHLPTSVRPSDWKFFGHHFGQDGIGDLGRDREGHLAKHGSVPRSEDRRIRTFPYPVAAGCEFHAWSRVTGVPAGTTEGCTAADRRTSRSEFHPGARFGRIDGGSKRDRSRRRIDQ